MPRFRHIVPFVLLAASATAQTSATSPVHKTGTVVVRTTAQYALVALSPAGGGKLDHLWVFWPSDPLAPSIARYESAHVEYDGIGTLIVIVADKHEARAFVAGMAPPHLPPSFSTTTLTGIGLNHQFGEEQLSGLAISKKGSKKPTATGSRRRPSPNYDICRVDFDCAAHLSFR